MYTTTPDNNGTFASLFSNPPQQRPEQNKAPQTVLSAPVEDDAEDIALLQQIQAMPHVSMKDDEQTVGDMATTPAAPVVKKAQRKTAPKAKKAAAKKPAKKVKKVAKKAPAKKKKAAAKKKKAVKPKAKKPAKKTPAKKKKASAKTKKALKPKAKKAGRKGGKKTLKKKSAKKPARRTVKR